MIYTSIVLIILISILLLYNQWKFNKGVLFLIFAIVFGSLRVFTFFLIFNPSDLGALASLFLQASTNEKNKINHINIHIT